MNSNKFQTQNLNCKHSIKLANFGHFEMMDAIQKKYSNAKLEWKRPSLFIKFSIQIRILKTRFSLSEIAAAGLNAKPIHRQKADEIRI